jgi:hypothetical protein
MGPIETMESTKHPGPSAGRTFGRAVVAAGLIGLVPVLAAAQIVRPSITASVPVPAPQTSGSDNTGPISGYMDFHFNKRQYEDSIVDFHRFVLLFSHRFSDRIRFTGELELEHAFVEGLESAGEIELEQGYVDFLLSRRFNLRAGMMLVPVGIINERHEPPVYNGVERPFVDTVVVPSTCSSRAPECTANWGRAGAIARS